MKRQLHITTLGIAVLALVQWPCVRGADLPRDPAIAAAIARIKAFDNHTHPLRVTAEGDARERAPALQAGTVGYPCALNGQTSQD